MALFELMTRPEDFKIDAANSGDPALRDKGHHPTLCRFIRMWARGEITKAQIVAGLGMTADDQADLDWLKVRYDLAMDKARFLERFYDTTQVAAQGLLGLDVKSAYVAAINAIAV